MNAANKSFSINPLDNGVLTRLGLIHSLEKENETHWNDPHWDGEDVPLPLRTLWHPSAVAVPVPNQNDTFTHTQLSDIPSTCSIWAHPTLVMLNYVDIVEDMSTDCPIAFTPHHALVWAKDAAELKHLKRISVLRDEKDRSNNRCSIIGIRVSYQNPDSHPPRSIGKSRPPPPYKHSVCGTETDSEEWPESHMSHFDIDGPGGECILRLHFDISEWRPHRLLLQTTRNRVCVWGVPIADVRDVMHYWSNRPARRVAGGLVAAWSPASGDLVVATALKIRGCTEGVRDLRDVALRPEDLYEDVRDGAGKE